jgi:hypothetical protein
LKKLPEDVRNKMGYMKKGGKTKKDGLAVMIAIGEPKKPVKKMGGGMAYAKGGMACAKDGGEMMKPVKKAQGGAGKVRKGMMTPEGQIVNDLTLGEYSIVITSTPYRATMEDSQFEQAMGMREAGIQIPDSVIIENSRLNRKADIVKAMAGDKESPEAQKRLELEMRALEADVVEKENKARKTGADGELSTARAEKTMVDAQVASGQDQSGQAEMQKIQMEHELKREQMEREFAMKQEQMDREYAMKQEQMRNDMALEQEKMQREMALQEQVEQQRVEVERILGEKQVDDEFKASASRVRDAVLENLNTINRFQPAVNEAYATLESAYNAVRAADMGITPEEFFTKHRLTVMAEPLQGGQVFEQALATQNIKEKTLGDLRLTFDLARAVIDFDKPASLLDTADMKALRDLIGQISEAAAQARVQGVDEWERQLLRQFRKRPG